MSIRLRAPALLLFTGVSLTAGAALAQPVSSGGAREVAAAPFPAGNSWPGTFDRITGPRSPLPKDWIGLRAVAVDTPILVMAGHADSQNISGSGIPGAAVAAGAAPMYPGISDELYWNMVIAQEVVALGQQRGLRISYHRPPFRTIHDEDAPGTNWTVGREHAAAGGYAMEIHFDAWGPSGVGSGLIPPLHRPFSRIDESLAEAFGAYPMAFRSGLGAPRRGIGLLEIGKLEGYLEAALRDPRTRPQTVRTIATRVVDALERGLGRSPRPGSTAAANPGLRRPPGADGSAPPVRNLRASSADE